jgi:hypothetical protein
MTSIPLPTVQEHTSGFWVMRAVAGPFTSHAAAWAWIDDHTDEGRADSDRYNRIRIAFAGDGGAPTKTKNSCT